MANYLNKLQEAKEKWKEIEHARVKPTDANQIKERADLAESFEKDIQHTHHCSLAEYQLWLRNVRRDWVNERYVNAAVVNLEQLTPLEIRLAAFTIGVKIGLLYVGLSSKSIVDEYGRIMPASEYEFFGPNTKEVLLMAQGQLTYYGLHPRMKLNQHLQNNIKLVDFLRMQEVENYWKAIDIKNIK